MLRFYCPVNPMASCQAWSVYLTIHSFARHRKLHFLNQRKGENDRRKYFMINLHERMLPTQRGSNCNLLITSRTRIQMSQRGRFTFCNYNRFCVLIIQLFVSYVLSKYFNHTEMEGVLMKDYAIKRHTVMSYIPSPMGFIPGIS